MNCFHFSVSLRYNTTLTILRPKKSLLWIAFIFQYLWDTTQPNLFAPSTAAGCELLSFFSIFGIQHNEKNFNRSATLVVNCFHFSVSLGYNTTTQKKTLEKLKLWIAFIFQYLWDTTQLLTSLNRHVDSCELLSFFSIFGIQHNNAKENAGET